MSLSPFPMKNQGFYIEVRNKKISPASAHMGRNRGNFYINHILIQIHYSGLHIHPLDDRFPLDQPNQGLHGRLPDSFLVLAHMRIRIFPIG